MLTNDAASCGWACVQYKTPSGKILPEGVCV